MSMALKDTVLLSSMNPQIKNTAETGFPRGKSSKNFYFYCGIC